MRMARALNFDVESIKIDLEGMDLSCFKSILYNTHQVYSRKEEWVFDSDEFGPKWIENSNRNRTSTSTSSTDSSSGSSAYDSGSSGTSITSSGRYSRPLLPHLPHRSYELPKYVSIEVFDVPIAYEVLSIAFQHGYKSWKLVEQSGYYRSICAAHFRGEDGTFGFASPLVLRTTFGKIVSRKEFNRILVSSILFVVIRFTTPSTSSVK
jgi:hypothetical protein